KDSVDFRSFLVPPKDYYWLAADFVQIEYRIMMCLAGEEELKQAFIDGVDFHKKTAALLFNKKLENVTPADRGRGKTLNFGISYGMSYYSLARILNISFDAAEDLMKEYFKKLRNLQRFIEKCKKEAYEKGFVKTAFGRIRDFSILRTSKDKGAIKSALRATFNTIIQGTAADINKMAVAAVYKAKQPYGDKILMVLNVHDELSLFVHNSIPIKEACKVISVMEQEFPERDWVKFTIKIEYGPNYGSLKSPFKEEPEKEQEEIPEFSHKVEDKDFDNVIVISTGEYADFKAVKLACSPAKPYAYRVMLEINKKIYLLPSSYSFNPTKKLLEHLNKLEGVNTVRVLKSEK
ncbi:MAG TPA: hypothetical protein ENI23_05870, partial [bacterium]|nr:hypothetical protein [bacterium]